jgi:hypothetical protein
MWEDDDSDSNSDYDPGEEMRRINALPIYQKAMEILDLTEGIVDLLDKAEPMQEIYRQLMMEDAMIIGPKIAGAEAMDDYILKMENAVIIKIHVRSLLTQTASLKLEGLVDVQYLQLLRNEIEAFRIIFLKWISGFEIDTTKEPDGWGLFVPEVE